MKTAAIFNHNRVHLSMVLPSLPSLSLFQSLCSSLLCLLWGVLIFHPTSNHHIDRLMGHPVGGQLEHAALAVVLIQVADELTTFIFLRMIQTSCKKMISALRPLISTSLASKLLHDCPRTHLYLMFCWDLGLSLISGHICITTSASKLHNNRFW